MGNSIEKHIVDIVPYSNDDFHLPNGCIAIVAQIDYKDLLVKGLHRFINDYDRIAHNSHVGSCTNCQADDSKPKSPRSRIFKRRNVLKPTDVVIEPTNFTAADLYDKSKGCFNTPSTDDMPSFNVEQDECIAAYFGDAVSETNVPQHIATDTNCKTDPMSQEHRSSLHTFNVNTEPNERFLQGFSPTEVCTIALIGDEAKATLPSTNVPTHITTDTNCRTDPKSQEHRSSLHTYNKASASPTRFSSKRGPTRFKFSNSLVRCSKGLATVVHGDKGPRIVWEDSGFEVSDKVYDRLFNAGDPFRLFRPYEVVDVDTLTVYKGIRDSYSSFASDWNNYEPQWIRV